MPWGYPRTGAGVPIGAGPRRRSARNLAAIRPAAAPTRVLRAVGGWRTTRLSFSVCHVDEASGAHAFRPADGVGGGGVRLQRQRSPRNGEGTVVRLPQAEQRACARPACPAPAVATLSFSYAERRVELSALVDRPQPQTYDLCTAHAARTRPPHGWQLRDRRPEDTRLPDARPSVPADLGGDRTVAVLAAALRAVPGAVSEDAALSPTAEIVPDRPAPLADVPQPRPVPAEQARADQRTLWPLQG